MNNPLVQPDPGTLHLDHPHVPRPAGAAREVRLAAAARGAREPRRTRSASRSTMRGRRSRSWSGCTSSRRASSPRRASRPRRSSRGRASDADRFREELKQKAQAEAAEHRQERRAADRAGDGARAPADPRTRRSTSRSPIASKILQRNVVEGRQRAPDRRDVQADRIDAATQLATWTHATFTSTVVTIDTWISGQAGSPSTSSTAGGGGRRSCCSPTPSAASASTTSPTASAASAGGWCRSSALAGLRFILRAAVLAPVHAAAGAACHSAQAFTAFLAGDAVGNLTPLGLRGQRADQGLPDPPSPRHPRGGVVARRRQPDLSRLGA